MASQAQISPLVGGRQQMDKDLTQGSDTSPIPSAAFAATKDLGSLKEAIGTITYLFGNVYKTSYLDKLNQNDLQFIVMENQDIIESASGTASAWEASTEYSRGTKVTNTGETLQATNSGTSDTTAPTSPASVGGTVVDNDITWVRTA